MRDNGVRRPDNRDVNVWVNVWPVIAAVVAVVALSAGIIVAGAFQAHGLAGPNAQPYGGCDEAWQAPESPGARDCRRLGWFVNRHVIVSPDGQATTTGPMRGCRYEDDPGPCYWDAKRRGNHAGHGFVTWPGRMLYVDYVNGRRVTTGPLQRAWFLTSSGR